MRKMSNLVEPNKTWVQQNRQTAFNTINQQASVTPVSLPDLSIQSKQSGPAFMRAVRLQQRCNLDSRKNDAYTFFHRICKIGEADGVAPV